MKTRIIHEQLLLERNRSLITLTGSVRLIPERNKVTLTATGGAYPTTGGTGSHYVTFWAFSPGDWTEWRGFEAEFANVKVDLQVVTSVTFKINNGVDDYFWNGSAWAVADANDWMNHEDIFPNMPTFPQPSGAFVRVMCRLATNDENVTPTLLGVKWMWDTTDTYDGQDDVFLRSLIPSMEANIRPTARLIFEAGGSNIHILDTDTIHESYDITTVHAAYDHTADPNHATDLLTLYEAGPKRLTLSTVIPAGNKVWIEFDYRPVVSMSTHTDFNEVATLPAIEIRNIRTFTSTRQPDPATIIDFSQAPPIVTSVIRSHRNNYRFDVVGLTGYTYDHVRLANAIQGYFTNNPLLRAVGLDQDFDMVLIQEYEKSDVQSPSDMRRSTAGVELRNVRLYLGGYQEEPALSRFVIGGDASVVVTP